MIPTESVPEVNAPAEDHADFLERSALRSGGNSVSCQDFIRDLRIGSAEEVIADSSDLNDGECDVEFEPQTEAIVQKAFDELDERRRNVGKDVAHYPFQITETTVRLQPNGERSLYIFLSLLSWFGKDAGPPGTDGEKIFEEVCARAAEAYLGGPSSRVKSLVFGFPRRTQPKGFAAAVDALCKSLGEGGGHRKGRPKLPDQKDAKLDIVAWVEFFDCREGKLITFGQCATGRNWEGKISELPSPDRWCCHWMNDCPAVTPVRSFFVPHRVERSRWVHSATFGGVLFDRCRIASLASEAGDELKDQWVRWSAHVLSKLKGASP